MGYLPRWLVGTACVLLSACHPVERARTEAAATACQKRQRLTTWPEVHDCLGRLNETTERAELVALFGKPYKEYDTSALDERALYFDAPGIAGKMFWVIVDVESGRFRYSAHELYPK